MFFHVYLKNLRKNHYSVRYRRKCGFQQFFHQGVEEEVIELISEEWRFQTVNQDIVSDNRAKFHLCFNFKNFALIFRFYERHSGLLKFKMYAGVLGRSVPVTARRLVAFIFHPTDPFAISVQRTNSDYIVNFHLRNVPVSLIS